MKTSHKVFTIIFALIFLIVSNSAHAALSTGLKSYFAFDNGAYYIDSRYYSSIVPTVGKEPINDSAIYKLGTGSLKFSESGATDFATASYPLNTSTADAYTICGWVNSTVENANTFFGAGTSSATSATYAYVMRQNSGDKITLWEYDHLWDFTQTYTNNTWYFACLIHTGGDNFQLWWNAANIGNQTVVPSASYTGGKFFFGNVFDFGIPHDGNIDEVGIWNRTLNNSEITELYNGGNGMTYAQVVGDFFPVISALNCTSCNIPNGDTVAPYTTSDTTPTFNFTTDINAWCRIADQNWNYTTMGGTRNCTAGEGATSHICTLTAQDELNAANSSVYISCRDVGNNHPFNSSSGALEMEITGFASNASAAIDLGIQASTVWPQATVYSNQQVYLRDLNNNQVLATVDRVVAYGNQRWLLNYAEDANLLGLFNITPVVYVLDMKNMTFSQITPQVTAFINTTKT